MIGWLLAAGYLAGYAWGFRWMLAGARRAYTDPRSMMWDVLGGGQDWMGVAIWSVGVPLVPLAWPLLLAGLWVWSMVVPRADQEAPR